MYLLYSNDLKLRNQTTWFTITQNTWVNEILFSFTEVLLWPTCPLLQWRLWCVTQSPLRAGNLVLPQLLAAWLRAESSLGVSLRWRESLGQLIGERAEGVGRLGPVASDSSHLWRPISSRAPPWDWLRLLQLNRSSASLAPALPGGQVPINPFHANLCFWVYVLGFD